MLMVVTKKIRIIIMKQYKEERLKAEIDVCQILR